MAARITRSYSRTRASDLSDVLTWAATELRGRIAEDEAHGMADQLTDRNRHLAALAEAEAAAIDARLTR